MEELVKVSIKDLEEDLEELKYLYQDCVNKLSKFNKEIDSKKNDISTYYDTKTTTLNYLKNQSKLITKIENDLQKAKNSKSLKELLYLKNKKIVYFNLLRTNVGLFSALITSTDWQSPTFNHSLYSLAGRQSGMIKHTISDYKRDLHIDEQSYEKSFLSEYVDLFFKLPVHAYAVSNGMAAFITIINFLITEKKINGNILIGKSIYFQNKEIIKRFFSDKVIEVDESNYKEVINCINKYEPSVIIFDTICNSINLAMPNLSDIIGYLTKNIKKETWLIIDNTTLPIFFQPLKLVKGKNKNLNLFILESLNKYHQFGMDRTTGGIILGYGKNAGKIYYSRQNSGTNISDLSVHMLPTPNKKLLSKRLMRLERNTKNLAESLQSFIDENDSSKFKRINYPSLKNYHSFSWSQSLQFHGSFFSIEFNSTKNPRTYKKFINHLIIIAKKNHVQISAGTSFGFNNTRVYLTSLRSEYGTPFIRISVGTENAYETEKIKEVFIKAISSF